MPDKKEPSKPNPPKRHINEGNKGSSKPVRNPIPPNKDSPPPPKK